MAKKKKTKKLTLKDLKKVKGGVMKERIKGNDLESNLPGKQYDIRNKEPGNISSSKNGGTSQ
jgi:hypothetical protein